MRPITLSWETWWAVIETLRATGLVSMVERADWLEQQLDQHPPGEPRHSFATMQIRSSPPDILIIY